MKEKGSRLEARGRILGQLPSGPHPGRVPEFKSGTSFSRAARLRRIHRATPSGAPTSSARRDTSPPRCLAALFAVRTGGLARPAIKPRTATCADVSCREAVSIGVFLGGAIARRRVSEISLRCREVGCPAGRRGPRRMKVVATVKKGPVTAGWPWLAVSSCDRSGGLPILKFFALPDEFGDQPARDDAYAFESVLGCWLPHATHVGGSTVSLSKIIGPKSETSNARCG